jgi:hypothetical protein
MTAIQKAREALTAAQDTLTAASRQLTNDHKIVLGGKRWGEATIAKIDAALAALDAETEVKVRELEWDDCSEEDGVGHVADTIVGRYLIEQDTTSATTWQLRFITLRFENEVHIDLAGGVPIDFAKAAAQADYERRIRSALVPPEARS